MSLSIDLPRNWNMIVDEFDEYGEFTAGHYSSGMKIHCNKIEQKYQLTAIHMTDGFTKQYHIDDKSDVPLSLTKVISEIEDRGL